MMPAETLCPPCPTCGGARLDVARPGPNVLPLYECTVCHEIESPLVGLVQPDDPPLALEPEPEPEPVDELLPPPPEEDEIAPPPEDEPAGELVEPAAVVQQLVELLPADFPLPALIKFAPDLRIRSEADVDAAKLFGMLVVDETSQRVVEACLTQQREHKKTIEALFQEPCAIAHNLHKHLTGLRGDWLARTDSAITTANGRLLARQRQVDREAAEARRRAQEDADRQAREQRQREAEAAKKASAPATVVEQLELEAKTATAPPVAHSSGGGGLRTSTVVQNWQPRLTATSRDAEHWQPEMAQLSPLEQEAVKRAMKAVVEGRLPLMTFEIGWPYIRARATADKKTFALEEFTAEDVGSLRAKPGARRK